MAASELRNKFAGTSLGTLWGFLQPLVMMLLYVFIFVFVFKQDTGGDYPYIVWFLPGIVMWMFLNDAVLSGSNSVRAYGYIIKKIVVPVDSVPVITVLASLFVPLVIYFLVVVLSLVLGVVPNFFKLAYIIASSLCFVVAVTRLTCAVSALAPDFQQLLGIAMQVLFWATPVVWNTSMLPQRLGFVFALNPFAYLVTGFREAFVGPWDPGGARVAPMLVFWAFTLAVFYYGNYVFNKNKKEFADVI